MRPNGDRLDWQKDGSIWPHREASQFLRTENHLWHVQIFGRDDAPLALLLHGTGAASHSWRNLAPLLARDFRVVVPDLPCHGFTRPIGRADLSLPGMVQAISELQRHLGRAPAMIIGHSAGAAIAVALAAGRTSASAQTVPRHVVGINGAFLPIRGNALFSPMAKAMFVNPFTPALFSLLARATPLGGNLLTATGSPIDEAGKAVYRLLLGTPDHVRGALGMMANWDLARFDTRLQRLAFPMTLIVAKDDPMVPPRNAYHAARIATGSRLITSETGGHLLHECRAEQVADWIAEVIKDKQPEGADAA